jgi:hypothetical protein
MKKAFSKIWMLGLIAGLTLGGQLAVAEVSPSVSTLYVVIAGNGACRRNSTFRYPAGLVETELFQSFVNSMLLTRVVTPWDNVIFTCYEWQSPQMQFYDMRGSHQMFSLHESQLDQLVLGRAQNIRRLVIIGHSHAGWRAMKLATSLLRITAQPILLATIDPVSRVTCQRLRDPGCREAPRDFSPQDFFNLNTRTRWLNLFHQPVIILGSSPIAAAHYNIQINANHVAMQTDPTVWEMIRRFVLSNR